MRVEVPAAIAPELREFVGAVDAIRTRYQSPRTIARMVGARLPSLLADGRWLAAEHRQPSKDHYQQHILYVAEDGGFSVVSLVWKPGQYTAIHDHVSWCVVGVLEGVERESRYRLYRENDTRFLVRRFERTARAGEVGVIVPPDEDIHRVTNVSDGIAISLHVYGANIRVLGSSVNRRFDDLAIRTRPAGVPDLWRTASA